MTSEYRLQEKLAGYLASINLCLLVLNLLKVSICDGSNPKARLVMMRLVDTVHISLSWDSRSGTPNCTTSFLNPW